MVSVNARRLDQEVAASEHHLLSARAQSKRSSKAAAGVAKPATNSRGATFVAAEIAKGVKPPPALTDPSRCSRPSCSACHQVPRTWVIPVHGGAVQRQRAKRLPLTVAWPSRVKLFRCEPSNGSPPPAGTQ
jgi:hypothetical protein